MIRPELDTAASDSPATKATASFPSFLIIFATCCEDLGNTKGGGWFKEEEGCQWPP